MGNFVIATSATEKELLDELVTRFLFGTNSSLRIVENKHFVTLMYLLHPVYNGIKVTSEEMFDAIRCATERNAASTITNIRVTREPY